MLITQNADCEICISRFDTKECINFSKGTTIDVDEQTAAYLLLMRTYDSNGNLTSDFSCPDLDFINDLDSRNVADGSPIPIPEEVFNKETRVANLKTNKKIKTSNFKKYLIIGLSALCFIIINLGLTFLLLKK